MQRKEDLTLTIIVVCTIWVLETWNMCGAQTEVTMRVPRTVDDCYAQALVRKY